jgi:hypothetical protein
MIVKPQHKAHQPTYSMRQPPKPVNRLPQRLTAPQNRIPPSASALFDHAFQAHNKASNRLADAEHAYRRALELQP